MKLPIVASYPAARFRRAKHRPETRALVRENTLTTDDLIWPVFICDGENVEQPVTSMPGVVRRSVDLIVEAAKGAADLGIPAICLFPYTDPALKTSDCAEAWNPNNLSNRATRAIKKAVPNIAVMTDVALDPYNIDGHDGFVVDGQILNDETVDALVKQTLSQAEAGADIIGPSDMMDGRIGAMREALETHGHRNVMIMSYAAKYASAFYGPFRDALESAPKHGDKKTYQMDPANRREALREAELDMMEGADILMVKPALCYLDVIMALKEVSDRPIAAYNVSGEYAMLKAAAEKGWIDYDKAMPEMLLSIHRAGADVILTYFAKEYAQAHRTWMGA